MLLSGAVGSLDRPAVQRFARGDGGKGVQY